MNILNVENVSKTYMSKPVLSDVSVGISDTDKIGVVGTNGTGKSTLLSIVAGVTEPDSGQIVANNGLRISYLPQNPVFDMDKSLLENIADTIYAGVEFYSNLRRQHLWSYIKQIVNSGNSANTKLIINRCMVVLTSMPKFNLS